MRQPPRYLYRSLLFRLPLLRRYSAICLGRWIVCKHTEAEIPEQLRRHEMVHQEQMDRHGVLNFYLLYLVDYARNLWRYRKHDLAYRNIAFEREAYEREKLPEMPAGQG